MKLTLLHTSVAHNERFDEVRDILAPEVELSHVVRERWLSDAQNGISDALNEEITSWTQAQNEPVLCTCTTLGPVAEVAGALRIDRPLMQAAARSGGPVLLVYCLESTRIPSTTLLSEEMGPDADIRPLSLTRHWPLFEGGKHRAFEVALASDIRAAAPKSGCVVLAQASMAGAALHLSDLPVPVLSSPELAFRAALNRTRLQID